MKKLQKIIIILVSVFTLNFAYTSVKAANGEQFYEGEWIPDIYINKVMNNGYKKYQQAQIIRRKSDNQFAYCLEPFVKLKSNASYNEVSKNYQNSFYASVKQWHRVNLLAYYGYMYEGHEDPKWYAITQVLIWKIFYPDYDIYFTDTLNGKKKVNAYQEEIAELERLIISHDKNISFLSNNINLNINDKISLTDTNGLLKDFSLTNSTIPAHLNNNTLTVEGTIIGEQTISLVKKDNKYTSVPLLYIDDNSQNILMSGSFEPINIDMKVQVNGYALKVQKVDMDTRQPIKKAGLQFKIKNLNTGEFIENPDNQKDKYIFETNNEGYFKTSNILTYGKYEITEESISLDGYLWNKKPLVIELNENTSYLKDDNNCFYTTIMFENKKITGQIIVQKNGEIFESNNNNFSYSFTSLADATIGLYAKNNIMDINGQIIFKKNELVSQGKTDNKGQITFDNLYLGDYYLQEIATPESYELDKTKYIVSLKSDNKKAVVEAKTTLTNYLKKGNVTITKVSSLTGSPLENAKIGIFNENDKLISSAITDSEGKIILNDLPLGFYYLKELEAPQGYSKSDEITPFNLTSSGEVIYIELPNDPIIAIPDTYIKQNMTSELMCLGEMSLVVLCYILKRKLKK